jgi:hypothetical protein
LKKAQSQASGNALPRPIINKRLGIGLAAVVKMKLDKQRVKT